MLSRRCYICAQQIPYGEGVAAQRHEGGFIVAAVHPDCIRGKREWIYERKMFQYEYREHGA